MDDLILWVVGLVVVASVVGAVASVRADMRKAARRFDAAQADHAANMREAERTGYHPPAGMG